MFTKKMVFAIVDFTEEMHDKMAGQFRVDKEKDLPTIRAMHIKSSFKFKFEQYPSMLENFKATEIGYFIDALIEQKAPPHIESEEPVTKQKGPVMEVVGSEFTDLVDAPSVPILMMVYNSKQKGYKKHLEKIATVAKKINKPREIQFH